MAEIVNLGLKNNMFFNVFVQNPVVFHNVLKNNMFFNVLVEKHVFQNIIKNMLFFNVLKNKHFLVVFHILVEKQVEKES